MAAAFEVELFATDKGRCPFEKFAEGLDEKFSGQIVADIAALQEHGLKNAPIQKKPIKGHAGMWEMKTGGYRTFFMEHDGVYWILGCCKKQDQDQEIANCAARMKVVQARRKK